MTNWLHVYRDVVINPKRAFQTLREMPPSPLPLAVFIVIAAGTMLLLPIDPAMSTRIAQKAPWLGNKAVFALFAVCASVALALLDTAMTHLSATLLSGQGRARSFWMAFLCITTVGTLFRVLPVPGLAILAALWTVVVDVIAISVIYALEWPKALVAVILKWVLTGVGAVAVGITLAVGIALFTAMAR